MSILMLMSMLMFIWTSLKVNTIAFAFEQFKVDLEMLKNTQFQKWRKASHLLSLIELSPREAKGRAQNNFSAINKNWW